MPDKRALPDKCLGADPQCPVRRLIRSLSAVDTRENDSSLRALGAPWDLNGAGYSSSAGGC